MRVWLRLRSVAIHSIIVATNRAPEKIATHRSALMPPLRFAPDGHSERHGPRERVRVIDFSACQDETAASVPGSRPGTFRFLGDAAWLPTRHSGDRASRPPDGVYNRAPLAFERGEGVRLYDGDGEAYLDCLAGIAVTALGHGHPKLVQAVKDQADKLWHTSNIFRIPGQEALAKALTEASFADVVFFTNSGSEAVECALKTARSITPPTASPSGST